MKTHTNTVKERKNTQRKKRIICNVFMALFATMAMPLERATILLL